MKCNIKGCPGVYDEKKITHTVKSRGSVVVIDHVPALICDVCGDSLLRLETVRHIEGIVKAKAEPSQTVPLYEYA
ncbi:MAG: YgiT-type zinc finger protein [Nitrospinae bacterium]|nr:YgiT-type zinc finger protein [Nitrospinota bacterium]MBF0633603.1 YgiT-type zinc finger protein [Nitrospinota bacterium]